MSKYEEEMLKCPKCGKEQLVKRYESVNVTLNPEIKEKIKSGYFFVFECEECHVQIPMIYPCLFHDMENRHMVWLVPNCNEEQIEQINEINANNDIPKDFTINYQNRIVKNSDSFREKVLIWDEGLDDRVMEILKIVYMSKVEDDLKNRKLINVLFEVLDSGYAFIFVFEEGEPGMVNIDMDLYRSVTDTYMMKIKDNTPKDFSIVDGKWARGILLG